MFQKMKFLPSEMAPKLVAENASAFFASASNKILPKKFSTPLHKLILHCILFLVLCSAIPLLCALLAGVPLPINFSGSPVLVGSYYQMFFCIYYSLFSLHSMFKTLSSSKRVEIMFRLNQAWRNSPSSSPRKASHAL
jgi:hypothetical protein